MNKKGIRASVSILGCGWLGKALTNKLVSQQYSVVVSTQKKSKVSELLALGVEVECFTLNDKTPQISDFQLSLFQQSCLIIAIPPGIRQGKKDYPDKIKHIVQLAQAGNVQQLIMISSTAVYNGLTGNVEESAVLDLSSEKVSLINKAEEEALNFSGETLILRLSGLVGPDRHPGKFLRGGKLLSDPEATTNLIHQDDAVGLLLSLINQPQHTAIYNGSSHTHVCKREYYERAARVIGLPHPKFNLANDLTEGLPSLNKIINSNKIRQSLGYTFKYDNLLTWLDNT